MIDHRKGPRPLYQHMLTAQILWGKEVDFAQKMIQLSQAFVRYNSFDYCYDYRQDKDVLWQKDGCTLLGQEALFKDKEKKVVLLLPSLINGAGIFDLTQQHSFYKFLIAQGLCPILFDWGSTVTTLAGATVESLSRNYVAPALRFLYQSRQDTPVTLGYCIGGVMSILAQEMLMNERGTEDIDKATPLILLATPWDFASEADLTHKWAQNLYASSLKQKGMVPPDVMPSYFASLDPAYALQKYLDFNAMEGEDARIFVSVEDWANAVQPLGWGVFRDILKRYYIDNHFKDIHLHEAVRSRCQALIVVAQKDRIVAQESALALQDVFDNSQLLTPDLGHVGLMASRSAEEKLWEPILRWIENAD